MEPFVNKGTHTGVNNCLYLCQQWKQWREASPQILKALSVSGTANRKSNLLCHTQTCLTTLNNCTAAWERAVFLLSNEGLQGRGHGVCACVRMWICLCAQIGVICNMWLWTSHQIYVQWKDKLLRNEEDTHFTVHIWSSHASVPFLPYCSAKNIDSSNLHVASWSCPVWGFEAVLWFNNAEADGRENKKPLCLVLDTVEKCWVHTLLPACRLASVGFGRVASELAGQLQHPSAT